MYLNLPQHKNRARNTLYLVTHGGSIKGPSIYEFSTSGLNITREVTLPVLEGYQDFFKGGCALVKRDRSILFFGTWMHPNRYDVAVEYDIKRGKTQLVQTPRMGAWRGSAFSAAGDSKGNVYLFSTYAEEDGSYRTGFYYYDTRRNETAFIDVSGTSGGPSERLILTTTFYAEKLKRLYIFGGTFEFAEFKDEIWYVDVSRLTDKNKRSEYERGPFQGKIGPLGSREQDEE
ncbi:uncharacterized protein LOC118439032 [Folsomia candida]|uniref:Uncharacterized protein n=1 Tax=Folsomia candida TaxID=158441 RepID=A0A226D9Z8_FOLCA|nr:uncharacterized protein LOC118439032 [Folsomia candida]OXA41557.1 hypothetical protein Fcan01_23693 [Folsomia candida]